MVDSEIVSPHRPVVVVTIALSHCDRLTLLINYTWYFYLIYVWHTLEIRNGIESGLTNMALIPLKFTLERYQSYINIWMEHSVLDVNVIKWNKILISEIFVTFVRVIKRTMFSSGTELGSHFFIGWKHCFCWKHWFSQ